MIIRSVFSRYSASLVNNQCIQISGKIISSITCFNFPQAMNFHLSPQDLAARKGTRARKAKGKVKREEKLRPFLSRLEREKHQIYENKRPFDKSHYPEPIDDVYFYRKYQYTQWSFQEAVQNHREIHHPTVYNMPNSPLILRIDMDFKYPKRPQKCMDPWKTIVEMKTSFLLPGMTVPSVLAFIPNDVNVLKATLAAGADMAGGIEIVKSIQQGEISGNDYEYIVCHPLMVPEITSIRGLIKKKFPTFKHGTIDVDIPNAVKRLKGGLKIHVVHSDREPDYASIETPIGTLDMDSSNLEGNFEAILRDTLPRRVSGKEPNDFILQCLLKTPNSFEEFKIDIQDAIQRNDKKGQGVKEILEEKPEEVDEEDVEKKTAAV